MSVFHFVISVFPSFSIIDHSNTLTHIKNTVENPRLYILHTTARLTRLVHAQPSRNHETLKREDKKQHRTKQNKTRQKPKPVGSSDLQHLQQDGDNRTRPLLPNRQTISCRKPPRKSRYATPQRDRAPRFLTRRYREPEKLVQASKMVHNTRVHITRRKRHIRGVESFGGSAWNRKRISRFYGSFWLGGHVVLAGVCFWPLFWAPLSEFFGRCLFYISFTGYLASTFLCALRMISRPCLSGGF